MVYILPWAYAPEHSAEIMRQANSHFLNQVAAIMPVIREPAMGVHTERHDFSDSEQHLSIDGAKKRSAYVAEALIVELN